jgi:hypothetical protein
VNSFCDQSSRGSERKRKSRGPFFINTNQNPCHVGYESVGLRRRSQGAGPGKIGD